MNGEIHRLDDIDSCFLVLIFGDPDNGESVGDIPDDKVHVICRKYFVPSFCHVQHLDKF